VKTLRRFWKILRTTRPDPSAESAPEPWHYADGTSTLTSRPDVREIRARCRGMLVSWSCVATRAAVTPDRLRDILAGRVEASEEELSRINQSLDAIQAERVRIFELANQHHVRIGQIF
jgi:hypothetical protein